MRTVILLGFVVLVALNSVYAEIINVPADQPTIQKGLDSASEGDTVLVQPGVYYEKIYINGRRKISIFSLFEMTGKNEYIAQTVIDAEDKGSVLRLRKSSLLFLSGFTLQNGRGYSASFGFITASLGGGIQCDLRSNVRIANVVIKDNFAHFGGGIFCFGNSKMTLENVTIINNEVNRNGIKIGPGIFCTEAEIILLNSIVWRNQHSKSIHLTASAKMTVAYSDFEDINVVTGGTLNLLDGNINKDPKFVDEQNDNFALQIASPCLETGTPFLVWNGDTLINKSPADYSGSAPDMGAYELPLSANPPVISPVANQSMDEDNTLQIILSATDLDGNALSYSAESEIDSLSFVVDNQAAMLTILPDSNWFGQTNITAIVSDGAWTDSTEFLLMVKPVNDPPVISIQDKAIVENSQFVLTLPITDVDGDSISYQVEWDNENIQIDIESNNVTLASANNWTGDVLIKVIASDGILLFEETFTLNVYMKQGTLKWKFSTGIQNVSTCTAIAEDGTLYLTSSGTMRLFALNPDGTKKWDFNTAGTLSGSSPSIGPDGTIYLGSYGGRLFAINPNGTEKWVLMNCGIATTTALANDGTIYFGGNVTTSKSSRKVFAVDSKGRTKWTFVTGGYMDSSPAIGPDGTIYIGSKEPAYKLYAINPDGTEKWSFYAGEYNDIISSPAIAEDGTVYFGADKNFFALSKHGSLKWKLNKGGPSSPAIDIDGTVYFGSQDSRLYAIDPSGQIKWTFKTGNMIFSSPAIGADGTIYIGSWDKKMYAINPDGSEQWSYSTKNRIMSSPAISKDGAIYFGSDDNNFYAIYSFSQGGLRNSAWPKIHFDAQNRGRYVKINVGFSEQQNSSPISYRLHQNYPNPFNPSTTIRFAMPQAGFVTLKIYDLLGREIATLVDGFRPAGEHEVTWRPADLSSGIYLYRLQAGEFVGTRKLILQK